MRVLWNTLCMFVYFSTCSECFSRTAHIIFINSCTKFGSHLTRKVMEPDFLKDSWARMTQNEVFPVFLKIGLWNFSIFWVKLQQQKVLKMTYGFFGSKISVWNFSGFFWMNLQWYKGLKLAQRIFFFFFFFLVGDLVLRFVDKKTSRESFLSFITNQCIQFFSLFAWS